MSDPHDVPQFDLVCEELIVKFDQERSTNACIDIATLIDGIAPEQRPRLVTEFACIDLEHAFDEGRAATVSPFLNQYPEVFEQRDLRDEVAKEHYRLSRMHGHAVTRLAVAQKYGVDGAQWSELPLGEPDVPVSASAYPQVGSLFCGYPLIAELGRGALARVYFSKQTDLAERPVVLKVTRRLTTEAEQLARLQHTGIIPIYSIHQESGLYGICMPYLGALTLGNLLSDGRVFNYPHRVTQAFSSTIVADRLSTIVASTKDQSSNQRDYSKSEKQQLFRLDHGNSQLAGPDLAVLEQQLGLEELATSLQEQYLNRDSLAAKVALIGQVVEAVAYAHQRGVVHCDLKPENILIANDGRPIILDFNLAAAESTKEPVLLGGTLPYMSPQQLRSVATGARHTPADDVFAIGVIFYQLLMGSLPFDNSGIGTDDLPFANDGRAAKPGPRVHIKDIPPSLNSIVQKCLEWEDSNRYLNATQLSEDLQRYCAHQVLKHAADRSPQERIRKWVRRHPLLTSTSSLAAASVVLLASLLWAFLALNARATRLAALNDANSFAAELPETVALLRSPGGEPDLLQAGIANATAIIERWKVGETGFDTSSPVQSLSSADRGRVTQQLGDLLYCLAGAEARLAITGESTDVGLLKSAYRWNFITAKIAPQFSEALVLRQLQLQKLSPEMPSYGLEHLKQAAADSGLFTQMLVAMESGDRQRWHELAEELVAERPTDPTRWFTLASARWTAGDFTRAREAFDVSAKLQKNSVAAVFWRGVCAMQFGDHRQAKEDFSQCLLQRDHWIAPRYNRALSNRATGDLALAMDDLNWIVDAGLAGPRVFSLRSQLHGTLGHPLQAADDQAWALKAPPRDADDWVTRGVLKISTQPHAALADFEHALSISAGNVAARFNIAHVQAEILGDQPAAIATLTKLVAADLGGASALASRGILHARIGMRDDAISDAQLTAGNNPSALEMLQLAGIYALTSRGTADLEIALAWLSKAIAANPDYRTLAAADRDLANLSGLPAFHELVDKSIESKPCK